MFRREHGIARAEVPRGANPLAHIQVRWIVRTRGHATGLIVITGERVHAEMKRHSELQFFEFVQCASGMGCRFDPSRSCGFRNLRNRQYGRRRHGFRKFSAIHSALFKANATYTPPDGDLVSLPPPAAITTYCLPSTSYVIGVALPEKGSVVSHSKSPVDLSNTRNFLS